MIVDFYVFFFFSSRRRHTRFDCDWSSDVCSSDLIRRRATTVRRASSIPHRFGSNGSPNRRGLTSCCHSEERSAFYARDEESASPVLRVPHTSLLRVGPFSTPAVAARRFISAAFSMRVLQTCRV